MEEDPGVKKLLGLVNRLKKSGQVKAVVMYTNAQDIPKGYVNFLRKCLEEFTNTHGMFDLILTRKDSHGVKAPMRKKLQIVVDRLWKMGIRSNVNDVLMVDDKPSTIFEYKYLKGINTNFNDGYKHSKMYTRPNNPCSEVLVNVPDYTRGTTKKTILGIMEVLRKNTKHITNNHISSILESYKYYDARNVGNNKSECEIPGKVGHVFKRGWFLHFTKT